MICALFSRLFRPIDFRAPWTARPNHGGGPLLDHLLAQQHARTTAPRCLPGEPLRIGMYLELHRDGQR